MEAIGSAAFTLLIGFLGYKIAEKLHLSAPGMLGSMLLVGITNILFGYASLPSWIKISAQALSGAYIGMQFIRKDIYNLRFLIVPFLILIMFFTINTFFVGWLIHVLCGTDLLTSLLSCVAGGVSDISMIAMDMNADVSMVAMMQTVRLVGVLLLFPAWIERITRKYGNTDNSDDRMITDQIKVSSPLDRFFRNRNLKIVFTVIISLIFGFLGDASDVPAASMVFPMVVVMVLNCTTNTCCIPKKIKLVDQIMAGSVVGASIAASTFSNLGTTLVPVFLLLGSYFLLNYIYSILVSKHHMLDLKSAMFASAPGGATDMTLIAADLGANLSKIAVIQVFRAAYAVTLMPFLIRLVCR